MVLIVQAPEARVLIVHTHEAKVLIVHAPEARVLIVHAPEAQGANCAHSWGTVHLLYTAYLALYTCIQPLLHDTLVVYRLCSTVHLFIHPL